MSNENRSEVNSVSFQEIDFQTEIEPRDPLILKSTSEKKVLNKQDHRKTFLIALKITFNNVI